jgi:hypothetical protein
MPRADYVPYSTVKPEELRRADEKVQISFPEVHFSNSIGQAVASVGQGMQTVSHATRVAQSFDNLGTNFNKVGETLWNRAIGLQDVQNQTTQTKAEIEFDKYVGEKNTAFDQLQGDAASEGALKAHLKDIDDARTKMLKTLPNEAVKRGFDLSSLKTVGRSGMKAAEHAAKETRAAFITSSEARVDQIQDRISKTDSPDETKDLAKSAHDEIFGKQAPAKGWGIEKAQEALQKILSDSYASQISRISRTDPTTARKMLETEENKALIRGPKYEETMNHILMNERVIQSRNIGNEIQEANPDAPLEEKIDKAKERAKEINPNSPLLSEDAVRIVKQKHEEHNREVKDASDKRKNTVEQALYGYDAPGGKMPMNREQLFAAGEEVRKAYESSTEKEQRRYDKVMEATAKGDVPETEATRHRVYDLEEMWAKQQVRFRDHDILSEQIPIKERTRLREKQLQVIKEGVKLEADPHTDRAINIMRAGGILPKDLKQGNPKWNAFSGMVREALVEQGKRQGFDKPLTEEQIRQIGNMVLEKQAGSGYWFNKDWGTVPLYETAKEVPSNMRKEILQDYPGLSEAAVLEKYRQLKVIKMFNDRAKASTTPAP